MTDQQPDPTPAAPESAPVPETAPAPPDTGGPVAPASEPTSPAPDPVPAPVPAPLAQAPAAVVVPIAPPPVQPGETPSLPQTREVPTVTHNRPTLSEGSFGKDVLNLVAYLAAAGYANNEIARGTQTIGYLDASVMADVRAFAREHDVAEDVEGWRGRDSVDAERVVANHVGPQIWQALIEVVADGRDVLS